MDDPTSDAWNIPAPVDFVGIDCILGRVSWASEQNLVVLWLNRRQNISILVNCDLRMDRCSIVKQQVEPNGWIDITEPIFDQAGTKMMQLEPQPVGDKRFMHVSQFDFQTFVTTDLTPTNSTVTELLSWNSQTETVYFIMSPESQPWLRQLWAATDGVLRCISCKEPSCHHVSAMFSPGASYAVLTCSASNVPPKAFLYNSQVIQSNLDVIFDLLASSTDHKKYILL